MRKSLSSPQRPWICDVAPTKHPRPDLTIEESRRLQPHPRHHFLARLWWSLALSFMISQHALDECAVRPPALVSGWKDFPPHGKESLLTGEVFKSSRCPYITTAHLFISDILVAELVKFDSPADVEVDFIAISTSVISWGRIPGLIHRQSHQVGQRQRQ